MKRLILSTISLLFTVAIFAQQTFPYNGVSDHREGHYAFTNATIFKNHNQKVENATLVIKNGKIVSVGMGSAPSDAVVIDAKGKTIYPSFVDIFSDYGMPEPKAIRESKDRSPQMLSNKEGAYTWNEALKTEFKAHEHFKVDEKTAKALRKSGFGAVLAHRPDGISRGTATLVALGEERPHLMILEKEAGHVLSFQRGKSTQTYPRSLMGIMALLRQTYFDSDWYQKGGKKEETNLSLDAWNEVQNLPQIFSVGDKLECLRASKIANQFGKKYILKGSGDEYQRIDAMKKTGSSFILPLNFPEAYDVENPYDAHNVSLTDMKHWELAPTNAAILAKEGIEFAFTADGLKKKGDFLKNIRKAIEGGLSEEAALKAITSTPAKMINAGGKVGTLQTGAVANFIITNGNIFEEKTKIHHNWVNGKPFVIKQITGEETTGIYNLSVGKRAYELHVGEKAKAHIQVSDSVKLDVSYSNKNDIVSLVFADSTNAGKKVRLSGTSQENNMAGEGNWSDGSWVTWSANRKNDLPKKEKKEKKKPAPDAPQYGDITYPFTPYGWKEKPEQQSVLFQNATVWTNEKDGILENADVLIQNGKIRGVGKGLKAGGATVIDATGKHITSGIIDEHTHIAISRGVNEGSQASSAEVTIADVVNSEDVNLYRQLAGGVTAAQQLHGSANPIGGQSSIIKFRWGFEPEEMKIKGADGFIKFALGENVKQSNWGDRNTVRFPQTRMGVEQVFVDHFTRANDYKKAKAAGKFVRKDLEMETLQEILEKKRFITCHSYVQSEINMLMKVAEQFDFTLNTFTHILEGYKVADKMAKHGAGGSTFSDWWAYKFEVKDAIPYNAALMHEQGVVVALNSDDAEMARRLNQEAAKAVKYGAVSEEEAWKMVTLNPAKLLHLDNRMGSLKTGKDADVVLWSDHPLSIYAKAEQTYVDGIKFFDRTEDEQMQKEISAERNRLIQKMLAAKKKGGKTQPAMGKHHHHYHCDDMDDEGNH